MVAKTRFALSGSLGELLSGAVFVIISSRCISNNSGELVFVMRQMCISYLTFSDAVAHVVILHHNILGNDLL